MIVKILLQHGANPDLHDEEGRTALEKARERNDEIHQKVVRILESPSNYITVNNHTNSSLNSSSNTDKSSTQKSKDNVQSILQEVDLVLAKKILQKLVPILCDIFQVCH